MVGCDVKFKVLNDFQKAGVIDKNRKIIDLGLFDRHNIAYTDHARNKYGVEIPGEMLFIAKPINSLNDKFTRDDDYRAVPNEALFAMVQHAVDEKNNINNVNKSTPIKPGVPELFESNPELANSVYEALGFKKERTIETAKGSTYRYLPSGKTQRFKKVEGKEYEPQDILTFVPNYEWIKSNNPQWLEKQGLENDTQYTQYLLKKVQGKDKVWIVDSKGKKIETNQDAKTADRLFIAFGKKDGTVEDFIPVSKEPIIGFYTYDSRIHFDEKGERYRDRHLGNKVVKITEGITPQQKQQAQQIYSQYLDSIGVTDIAYHHSEEDISEFTSSSERYFQKELKKKNRYIPKLDDIVFLVKKPLTEEFMSKRKFIGSWGLKTPKTLQFNAGEKIGEGVHPGIDEGIFAGIEGNYDAIDFGRIRDNKTWSEVIAITNPKNAIKLGSKQDIEGFKDFVKNNTGTSRFSKVSEIEDNNTASLNELNIKLEKYLTQFGFTTEQLDDLKQVTGYSIIGATDFLEKTIFVQKENINQAYTKEAAYSIFNLLGRKNLLRKDLIASIHLLDNYDSLKSKYINSKLSDYKIRELIAIDYLQQKLIDAHKEVLSTTNKAISKDVTAKNKLEYIILKIKQWWSDIIRKFFKSYKKGYIEDVFNQIANDVINNNTRLFNLSKEVSYKKMELAEKQKEINDNLVRLGAINSGSYSLNRQGSLTRESINDLDYFLPYEIKDEVIKNIVKKYPQVIFSEPYSGIMGNRSLTLSLKIDDVKIDFFLPMSQEESDKNKIIVIDGVKYHHWKNIFDAKVRIGSKKHLSDLAGFTPFRKDFFLFDQNIYEDIENLQKQLENAKDSYAYLKNNWDGRFGQFYERMIDREYQIKELEKKLKSISFPVYKSEKLNIIGQRHYNFDFIQSKYNIKEYSSDEQVVQSDNLKIYWDKNLEQSALNYFKDNNIDFEKSIQYQDLLSYFNNKKDRAIIAYYLTFSENFKKFYGNIESRKNLSSFIFNSINGNYSKNSILLDENNEPVIFYHGAGTMFDKFSKDYFLSGEGAMAYGAGFYSTNYKPTADNYRDVSKTAMNTFRKLLEEKNQQLLDLISKLKIDINENTLIGFMSGSLNIEDIKSKTELLNLLGLTETKALYIALTNPLYWQNDISKRNKDLIESHFGIKLENNNSGRIYRELQKTLKISDKELSARLYQIGIDGVINIAGGGQAVGGFSHKRGETHVVFFEPVQAKAVNNSGLFSLNNENMYDPIEIKERDSVNKNNFQFSKAIDIEDNNDNVNIRETFFPNGNTYAIPMLRHLSQQKSRFNPLVKKLLEHSSRVSTRINLVSTSSVIGMNRNGVWEEGSGIYDAKQDLIRVAEFSTRSAASMRYLLLHEIIHAYSHDAINSNSQVGRDIFELFQYARRELYKKMGNEYKNIYGVKDVHEFVSELFTNPNFMKILLTIPPLKSQARYKNLFEEILDEFISYFIGKNIDTSDSLYQQAFAVATHLIERTPMEDQDQMSAEVAPKEIEIATKNFNEELEKEAEKNRILDEAVIKEVPIEWEPHSDLLMAKYPEISEEDFVNLSKKEQEYLIKCL